MLLGPVTGRVKDRNLMLSGGKPKLTSSPIDTHNDQRRFTITASIGWEGEDAEQRG